MTFCHAKGWKRTAGLVRIHFLGIVLASMLVPQGTVLGQVNGPQYGDTLVIGEIGNGVYHVDPVYQTLESEKEIAAYIFGEGLVSVDPQGRIVPGLAVAWEWNDERTSLKITFRRDAVFHNGDSLRAEDIVFTYQLYRSMKNDPDHFFNRNFEIINTVQVEGIDQVRFTLNAPHTKFFPDLATIPILPKKVYDAGTYFEIRDRILRIPPVGLGPFQFHSRDDGAAIVLGTNPTYYRGRSFLDGIVYRSYSTEELLKAAFVTGEIDFARIEGEYSARDVWRSNPRIRLVTLISNQKIFECICYNTSKSVFESAVTRTAFTHAIDRTGLLNELLSGKGNVAYGPLDSDSWAHYPNTPKHRFDPRKAIELLREEGWSDRDGNGVLEREGREFRFTLMFTKGSTFFERIARIIKLSLKEIGVDVIPEPVERKDMMRRMREGDYDASLMNFPFEAEVEHFDRIFHSSSIRSGTNVMFYSNREVDRLITLAYDVNEPDRLEPMFQRLQLLIGQDQPCTFLFFKWLLYAAADTRFQNIRKAVGGLNPYTEWYVPEADQRYRSH